MTNSFAIRCLAGLLAASGVVAAGAAWRHLSWAGQDEIYAAFHASAAVLLGLAAVLLCVIGLRLAACPELWSQYPFLASARFWRWLLFGWLVIFFSLGFALPGQDMARYPCRAACLLWLAVLLTPLLLPASRGREISGLWQRKIPKAFDLLVGNLVVLAVTLEVVLRIVAWWSGSDALLLNRTTGYRLKPGIYANGLRANSLGFADTEWSVEPPADRPRIAALGDSFSVGVAVAYEDNYLTLLEEELGVEVCNFGVCGTGPREYRNLLASLVWQYRPDLVLVPIFIGNDITEWIASPQLVKFHPDALYIELLTRRLVRLAREAWRRAEASARDEYRMGINVGFSEKTYLELTAGRLIVCRAEPTAENQKRWEMVERCLEELIRDCRDRAVPVAFVLIPDEFQIHEALRHKALALRGWREEDLDLHGPQRRLVEFLSARQVPVLDLFSALAEAGPVVYIPNDGHFTVTGHRIAAREVARWLRGQPQLVSPSKPAPTGFSSP
jgi:lysophospholipase L1-like esterase